MKLLKRDQQTAVFRLSKREKRQLLDLLSLYPRVPASHYRVSRGRHFPGVEENQHLLDEAVAEQRSENRRLLHDFLAAPGRFSEEAGSTMSMPTASLEWLLQILNEIRVGSWIAVGSPEGSILGILSAKTAPDIWAMELAGYFEACLLEAITGQNLTGAG